MHHQQTCRHSLRSVLLHHHGRQDLSGESHLFSADMNRSLWQLVETNGSYYMGRNILQINQQLKTAAQTLGGLA